jgi:hypothetical protein
VRAALVHAAPDDHLLLLSIHHIACDGWSLGVLARELSALYAAALRGSGDPLEAPRLGYPDFAVWQREHLSGELENTLFTWWRNRLGNGGTAEIPTDRPRPPVQSFRGAQLATSFGPAVSARLRALARAQRATPFMVLLAAWKAVMRRRLDCDRVVVGTDVAGRDLPEVAGVVGLFVNQVVLATDTSGDPSFLELLARVRATALEAYAHAALPFNRLVDALNPVRDPARNPLFQVMVVLDNTPAPELRLPGVAAEVMELQLAGAPFDLSLLLSEGGGGVHCVWRYNPDLFEPSTVERLAAELADALERATADPAIRLGALHAALDEAEEARRGAALERLRRASADRFRRATAPRRPSAPGAGAGPLS